VNCYVVLCVSVSVEDDNVVVLLPLAREYQIDDLTQRCEQFLLCREPSVRSLVLAEEFSLDTLEKQCLDYVNRSLLVQCIHCIQPVGPVLLFPSIPVIFVDFLPSLQFLFPPFSLVSIPDSNRLSMLSISK